MYICKEGNYDYLCSMDYDRIISDYYGVSLEDIRKKDRGRSRVETECLHFIWYFHHYHGDKSLRGLAREYDRSARNIRFCLAKIREGICLQKYYRDKKDDILALITKEEESER